MKTQRTKAPVSRTLLLAAVLATSAASLSACFPVAVGGMAYGALVVTDRRTTGAITEDKGIELKANTLISEQIKNSGGIGVVSFNRRVLLYGQVLTLADKQRAGEIVARIDNVHSVQNELRVMGRTSLGTEANDALLTTRVKAAFVDARDLQANAFKVVTEAGIVYLMGIVTRAEGDRAASVASRVPGVRKVVTVFEYVTEDELARIVRDQGGSPAQGSQGK